MTALTLEIMQRRWVNGNQHIPGLIEGIVAASAIKFPEYGLNTSLVVAHFMAQASEECDEGLEMWENMNYSAEGLLRTFPTHFTPARAARYAHNPRMIADIAYGGRMGNRPPPSDDGWVRRGRGLTNMTGVEGDEKCQKILDAHNAGFSILDNPELICDPEHALECGLADYLACGCLSFAENDDIKGETHALNGGYNGLAERIRQLRLWKHDLGVT